MAWLPSLYFHIDALLQMELKTLISYYLDSSYYNMDSSCNESFNVDVTLPKRCDFFHMVGVLCCWWTNTLGSHFVLALGHPQRSFSIDVRVWMFHMPLLHSMQSFYHTFLCTVALLFAKGWLFFIHAYAFYLSNARSSLSLWGIHQVGSVFSWTSDSRMMALNPYTRKEVPWPWLDDPTNDK